MAFKIELRLLPALLLTGALLPSSRVKAVPLVTDATINIQKDMTHTRTLRNGLKVVWRQIPGSDIVQLEAVVNRGLKDLPTGRKVLNEWLWAALPTASAHYPKAKVFEDLEKYGFDLGCSGGIEVSSCSLGTINDHWGEGLKLFADLFRRPAFAADDLKLTKDRLVAQLRSTASDPGKYVNEIVNTAFYPKGHPYRLNHDEALTELGPLGRADLVAYHQQLIGSDTVSLVVVTSLPEEKVLKDLDQAFGDLGRSSSTAVAVMPPPFRVDDAYAFHDRDLPSAYLRIKMNAPGVRDDDAAASMLLYDILNEELGDEIRTRRSLSYAVHAQLIPYSIGIGVITASTSKPKETLTAIDEVVKTFKARTYSEQELEEFKHIFATHYYLAQETHASLAGSLAHSLVFRGDATDGYDLPKRLAKVTPADIKRLAAKWLSNLRLGVITGRGEFSDEWARNLILANLTKS